ncbi:ATP synthase F0F1 subunit A [Kosmotoga arenicorallina S304]|uniref:ATP synthase subunit a n=1 Tax=Kosmotoga arenicorallina S304 TaxID=1453497 RepID=A0A176JXL6_9BACT|nr:F0F1 ATP synthase subunit A [Kosmotoga arenicorallina]OAA28462.1 ATP synthase F0F1 subunit A [Kosmotoga arenicorallina S304]
MKIQLTKFDKVFLSLIIVGYAIIMIYILSTGYQFPKLGEDVGQRWIYQLPFGDSLFSRINPMTIFMSWVIMIVLIAFAASIKVFEIIPGRKQSLIEMLLDYLLELTKDAVPKEEFIRPTFNIAATLFLFIFIANVISGFPGIQAVPKNGGVVFTIFEDTWYTPTSDLNTNATFAVMILFISHAFAIKAKGFGKWFKGFFEPSPIMFPMNLIGELAKPVSHSLRLFGNIMGGGLLVLIISYLTKYFLMPTFLWGFFGIFVGTIQALVFTILAIAYIGSVIE